MKQRAFDQLQKLLVPHVHGVLVRFDKSIRDIVEGIFESKILGQITIRTRFKSLSDIDSRLP